MAEKTSRVNEILKLPLADQFDKDLRAALEDADGVGVVALAFLDLDRFMAVNERYGHETGDDVIIKAGEHIRAHVPEGGRLYRYGGDQFAVLFTGEYEREDVFMRMEELRRAYDIKLPGGEVMTLSVGISAAPEDGTRAEELVRKADGAMYRAKVTGHNRVCLAREEKMVTKTSHYTTDQLQRLTKVSKREGIGEAILLREALDALLKKYDV